MSDEVVRLWDGKRYDARELSAIYPELFEHALNHECLVDYVELSDVKARQRRKPVRFRTALVGLSLPIAVVLGACLATGVEFAVTMFFVTVVALISGALLLACGVSRFRAENLPRSTFVRNGQLIFESPEHRIAAELDDCFWQLGNVSEDSWLANSLAKAPAVILLVPNLEQIAVGLEDSRRRLWKAFLEVTRVRPLESVGCAMHLLVLVFAISAGIGGWMLAEQVALALNPALPPAITEKLPGVVATISVWGVYLACNLCVPRMYQGTPDQFYGLLRFSIVMPLAVLGVGRKALGVVKWNPAEQIAIAALLVATLGWLTWRLLRSVNQRRKERWYASRSPFEVSQTG